MKFLIVAVANNLRGIIIGCYWFGAIAKKERYKQRKGNVDFHAKYKIEKYNLGASYNHNYREAIFNQIK
jgi:hypothetical protein